MEVCKRRISPSYSTAYVRVPAGRADRRRPESSSPTAPAGSGLTRVGGTGIYHTDAIVRRAEALQQTSHAQVPAARVHPDTLAALGLSDGATAEAVQNGSRVRVTVVADNTLPPNVVHLPQHPANAALGGLMNAIELEGV